MSYVSNSHARVDCLCFLVIGQLVARVKLGAWLQPDRIAELLVIWNAGRRESEYIDSSALSGLSEAIAADLFQIPDLRDLGALAKLISGKGTLDYHAPGVQAIFRICMARLASS
ncbi:hypothetical protein LFL96_36405 (plasmid) [Paraburkholderia sp. D15]|uniref:hypothetical protein n=1 Tax=Paraburkholderia sp. D15 TaxID=2880218 RepID=UPI002478CAB9|nr:hypothetical protein [Paraburkholderia sp. D15]WGS54969.1 hypothetical protein LFL96_36405 [Paraburkholderia sp. D15]